MSIGMRELDFDLYILHSITGEPTCRSATSLYLYALYEHQYRSP